MRDPLGGSLTWKIGDVGNHRLVKSGDIFEVTDQCFSYELRIFCCGGGNDPVDRNYNLKDSASSHDACLKKEISASHMKIAIHISSAASYFFFHRLFLFCFGRFYYCFQIVKLWIHSKTFLTIELSFSPGGYAAIPWLWSIQRDQENSNAFGFLRNTRIGC